MPESQAESFDIHDYIPELGGFRLTEAPHADVRSLLDITGGRFQLAGRAIINQQTHRIVGNLSLQESTHLSVGTQGTIMLHNAVPKSRLQEVMGTRAMPSSLITGSLTALGLPETEDINRFVTLAPRNSLVYVDESKPAGKGRYTKVDAGVFGDIAPPLVNEFGRLATPEQLMTRAVAGWMARNAPAALDRLKLAGYPLPDGTVTVNGSDIVRAIAANISVTPLVTYLLGEAP